MSAARTHPSTLEFRSTRDPGSKRLSLRRVPSSTKQPSPIQAGPMIWTPGPITQSLPMITGPKSVAVGETSLPRPTQIPSAICPSKRYPLISPRRTDRLIFR